MGRIYCPNTNALVDMGSGAGAVLTSGGNSDIIEQRANPNHDAEGKFTFGNSAKAELKAKIEGGEFPTKLDKVKQGRHIIGNPDYVKRISDGEFPSYITVGKMEIQKIINTKSMTGYVTKGKDGQYRELITADEYFGVCCSIVTHESIKTNRGVIHYSKSGTHLVPTFPEDM